MTDQTKKRGFASMTAQKRIDVASMGGKAAHALGKAHRFTSAEAKEAGRKGAAARQAKRAASRARSAQ